jgi:hypothetical protein
VAARPNCPTTFRGDRALPPHMTLAMWFEINPHLDFFDLGTVKVFRICT